MGWKSCVLLYLLKNIFNPREPYHQDLSWSKLQVEPDLDIAKKWASGQLPLFIFEIYLVKLGGQFLPVLYLHPWPLKLAPPWFETLNYYFIPN